MSDTTGKFFGHSEGNANIPLRKVLAVSIDIQEGVFMGARGTCMELMRQAIPFATPDALIDGFVRYTYRSYEMLLYQADYDMRYLIPPLERLVKNGFEITFTLDARQRIIYCKIARGEHRWYIRDVSSMLPVELPQLRQLAGVSGEVPIEQVILQAYQKLASTLRDTFGTRPAITVGTTALHAWSTTLPDHHIFYRQRPSVERLAREGYFGGLVWVQNQAEREDCTYIDVNAMYAHAMRQGVPVMSPTLTNHYYEGRPGIYNCRVFCPPSVPFAFVPARQEQGQGLTYPRGVEFETVMCSHTIELAREKGYTIDVIEGYVFETLAFPFDGFVTKCQELEGQYAGQGAAHVIKALRNSLNGKFGQRPEGKEYYLTENEEADMTPVLMWDGTIIDHLFYRRIEIERSYMQPVWAAWITATARNILTRAVYALGPRSCYYGDTDSIVVSNAALKAHPVSMGTQYGEWKVKREYLTFRAVASKFYRGITTDGEIDIVSAGIKRGVVTSENIDALQPHAPPVDTAPYKTQNRAINTIGGRPLESVPAVRTIVLEGYDNPFWADLELPLAKQGKA